MFYVSKYLVLLEGSALRAARLSSPRLKAGASRREHLVNMAHGERWYNRLWEVIYRINPAWVGGCRGVTLQGPMQAQGFISLRREFLSQVTFPAEIVFGVKP